MAGDLNQAELKRLDELMADVSAGSDEPVVMEPISNLKYDLEGRTSPLTSGEDARLAELLSEEVYMSQEVQQPAASTEQDSTVKPITPEEITAAETAIENTSTMEVEIPWAGTAMVKWITGLDIPSKATEPTARKLVDVPIEPETNAFLESAKTTSASAVYGIRQILGLEDDEYQQEARALAALMESEKYGTEATAGAVAGYAIEPVGFILPAAKAKSALGFASVMSGVGGTLGAVDYVSEDLGEDRMTNTLVGMSLGGALGYGLGKYLYKSGNLPEEVKKAVPSVAVRSEDIKATSASHIDAMSAFEDAFNRLADEGLEPKEILTKMNVDQPDVYKAGVQSFRETGESPTFIPSKKDRYVMHKLYNEDIAPDATLQVHGKSFAQETKEAATASVSSLDRVAGLISTRFLKHSPKLHKHLMDYEAQFKIFPQKIHEETGRIRKFFFSRKQRPVRGMNYLSREEASLLKKYMLNGNRDKATKMMQDLYGAEGKAAVDEVYNVFKKHGEELLELGIIDKLEDNYIPRIIPKEYRDDYLDAVNVFFASKRPGKTTVKAPASSIAQYEKHVAKVRANAEKRGRILSDFEESQIFYNWFIGRQGRTREIDRAMQRRFKIIPDDLLKYYADIPDAIDAWAHQMAKEKATVGLLGRDAYKAGMESIDKEGIFNEAVAIDQFAKGKTTSDLLGELDEAAQKEIIDLLKLRLGNGLVNTSAAVKYYKGLVNSFLLGNPFSAVVQLGDIPASAYRYGVKEAVDGLLTALKKDGAKVTREDLGLEKMFLEFEDIQGTKLEFFQEFMFQKSGFTKADALGKNTIINTALNKYTRAAKKGTGKAFKELEAKYSEAWGTEFNQLVRDLVKYSDDPVHDNLTDNIRTMLFTELSHVQPISLSEMPESVLRGNGWKFFWTLKSFMLKQADIVRRDMYRKAVRGFSKGGDRKEGLEAIKNLITFIGTIGIGNFTVNEARDLLTNKKDFSDYMDMAVGDRLTYLVMAPVLNSMKIFNIDSYLIRSLTNSGLVGGTLESLAPPVPVLDAAITGKTENIPLPMVGSGKRLEGFMSNLRGEDADPKSTLQGFSEGGEVQAETEEQATIPTREEALGVPQGPDEMDVAIEGQPLDDTPSSLSTLQAASLAFAPVPVVGDATGLAADIEMYVNDPESRTIGNFTLSALGALPFVPAAGIIVNAERSSKAADLARIQDVIASGDKTAKQVFEETGVYYDNIDELWKYQIADTGFKIHPEKLNHGEHIAVKDFVEGGKWDEIFSEVPELANTKVSIVETSPNSETVGWFYPPTDGSEGVIFLSSGLKPQDMKEVLLHEAQHGVQLFHDMSKGVNGNNIAALLGEDTYGEYLHLRADAERLSKVAGNGAKLKEINDRIDTIELATYFQYRSALGEAEARWVEEVFKDSPVRALTKEQADAVLDIPSDTNEWIAKTKQSILNNKSRIIPMHGMESLRQKGLEPELYPSKNGSNSIIQKKSKGGEIKPVMDKLEDGVYQDDDGRLFQIANGKLIDLKDKWQSLKAN